MIRQLVSAAKGGPVGFDLDNARLSCRVVMEAGPAPIVGSRNETSHDGIAMHVAKFLNALLLVMHVEVIVARLPEGSLGAAQGDGEFQCVDYVSNRAFGRFADQQMNMLRHHDISGDNKAATEPHPFQGVLEKSASTSRTKILEAMKTAESYGMEVIGVMKTD